MPVRITSEADLIETYLAPLARKTPGALGLKDDCGVLIPPPGRDIVVTTDAVAEGVHFFASDAAADVGWKALAVNVSDIAGKGAEPLAFVMALSFPEAPLHSWMQGFASGLNEAQDAFGIGLLGGDTDRRPGPITITITAFGGVEKGRMITRSGAKPGDVIFVSGTLGDSALGLKMREDSAASARWRISPGDAKHLTHRYLRPQPRLALRLPLLDCASSAMDVSDGLLKDLDRLCRASRVGAEIHRSRLPLSPGARTALAADSRLCAAIESQGDDYEILATVAAGRADAFVAKSAAAGITVTAIGTVQSGVGVSLRDQDGILVDTVDHLGFDHF